MLKDDYFAAAVGSDTIRRTEWTIKTFSLFREKLDKWKMEPYPYRPVAEPHGWFFVDPEDMTKLIKIDDAEPGQPIFKALDPFTIKAGTIANVDKDTDTTYGNVLVNAMCLALWFGKKIDFMVGLIKPQRLSAAVLNLLVDDPVEGEEIKSDVIYVSEYLQFCDAVFNLVAFTQVFTPAASEKSMTAPPDVVELRNILVEENKGRLHDPAVIANIARQLQEYDYEYLRGDSSLGFLLKDKSLKLVRTKLFLMYGAETGLEEKVDMVLIERSLSEGWDIDKFADMNNAQRAGSYNRGKETERGGAKVKEIYRATGNLKIAIPDCGSTLGTPYEAYPGTENQIIGFTTIAEDGTQTLITKENVGAYMGTVVKLRSPMYCRGEFTDYCEICCGERLSSSPDAIPLEFTAYGNRFLDMYMAAAHAKSLTVKELEFDKLLH